MEGGRVVRDQCNLNRFGNPEFNSHDVINCRICILMVENVRYWSCQRECQSVTSRPLLTRPSTVTVHVTMQWQKLETPSLSLSHAGQL